MNQRKHECAVVGGSVQCDGLGRVRTKILYHLNRLAKRAITSQGKPILIYQEKENAERTVYYYTRMDAKRT